MTTMDGIKEKKEKVGGLKKNRDWFVGLNEMLSRSFIKPSLSWAPSCSLLCERDLEGSTNDGTHSRGGIDMQCIFSPLYTLFWLLLEREREHQEFSRLYLYAVGRNEIKCRLSLPAWTRRFEKIVRLFRLRIHRKDGIHTEGQMNIFLQFFVFFK